MSGSGSGSEATIEMAVRGNLRQGETESPVVRLWHRRDHTDTDAGSTAAVEGVTVLTHVTALRVGLGALSGATQTLKTHRNSVRQEKHTIPKKNCGIRGRRKEREKETLVHSFRQTSQ